KLKQVPSLKASQSQSPQPSPSKKGSASKPSGNSRSPPKLAASLASLAAALAPPEDDAADDSDEELATTLQLPLAALRAMKRKATAAAKVLLKPADRWDGELDNAL